MEAATLALLFTAVSNQLDLPNGLLSAICFTESSHKPHAINLYDGGSPSIGLCQIKVATAKVLGFKGHSSDLKDPAINAFWAGRYLKKQLQRYDWNYYKAIAAYNAGTYKPNARGYAINNGYVTKVFLIWKGKS